MNKVLYVSLFFMWFLFSCERKVIDNSSKIIVKLPFNENSIESILNPLSLVSTYSIDQKDEDFNSVIIPSFSSGSAYPINCFLLGIGSLNSESMFKKNYCGKRSTVSGNIDRNFEFGPFAGLFPTGSSVELNVSSGDKRIIYVFGIHALNPAACLAFVAEKGKNPTKNNFSKPHFVGKSIPFSVASGQTTVIPVDLINPVANDNIDGCVLSTLSNENDSIANNLEIERNAFPKDILVGSFSGDTVPTNFRCDYVDIAPKFIDPGTGNIKSAHVDMTKQIAIKSNGTVIDSFPNKNDCENVNTPVSSFPLSPLEKSVRRWIVLPAAENASNKTLIAFSTDGTLQSNGRTFLVSAARVNPSGNLSNGLQAVRSAYDIIIPNKVITGECYSMFVVRKSLEDEDVTDGSISSVFNLNANVPAAVSFFTTSGCTSGAVTASSIPTSQSFIQLWFTAVSSFELTINATTGFADPVHNSSTYKIDAVNSTNSIQESVDVSAPEIVRQRSAYNCHPIIFRFKNADEAVIKNPSAGLIEILFNQTEGNFTGIDFYEDSNCSTTQITAANSTVTFPVNTEFRKIYIKTVSTTAIGPKVIRFKVSDGTKVYFPKIRFEAIAPNHPN